MYTLLISSVIASGDRRTRNRADHHHRDELTVGPILGRSRYHYRDDYPKISWEAQRQSYGKADRRRTPPPPRQGGTSSDCATAGILK